MASENVTKMNEFVDERGENMVEALVSVEMDKIGVYCDDGSWMSLEEYVQGELYDDDPNVTLYEFDWEVVESNMNENKLEIAVTARPEED